MPQITKRLLCSELGSVHLETPAALQDSISGLHAQLVDNVYHLDLTTIHALVDMTNTISTPSHKLRLGLTCLGVGLNAWVPLSPLSDHLLTTTPSGYARVACLLSP